MATPEELAQRQEVATIQVETAAHILDRVGNGTKTETVPTTNGPVPSVAKFFEDNQAEITAAAGAAGRFCGVSATAPTTRLDGSALREADEYHNSVDKLRYSWSGTAWVALNASVQALEVKLTDPTGADNGAAVLGRGTVSVDNMNDLALMPRRTDLRYAVNSCLGGWAALSPYRGPRGGGDWIWDALSTEAADGGTVLQVAGVTTGRFKRIFSGPVEVTWFGAMGIGGDDTVGIRAAHATQYNVHYPWGSYKSSTVQVKPGCKITGVGGGRFLPAGVRKSTVTSMAAGQILFDQSLSVSPAQEEAFCISSVVLVSDFPIRYNDPDKAIVDGALATSPYLMRPVVRDVSFTPLTVGSGTGISMAKCFDGEITRCEFNGFLIHTLLMGCDLNEVHLNRYSNIYRYGILNLSSATFGSQNEIYHNDMIRAEPSAIFIKTNERHPRIHDNYMEQASGSCLGFIDASDVDVPVYGVNTSSATRLSTIEVLKNRIDGHSLATSFVQRVDLSLATYADIEDVGTTGTQTYGGVIINDYITPRRGALQNRDISIRGRIYGKWSGYRLEQYQTNNGGISFNSRDLMALQSGKDQTNNLRVSGPVIIMPNTFEDAHVAWILPEGNTTLPNTLFAAGVTYTCTVVARTRSALGDTLRIGNGWTGGGGALNDFALVEQFKKFSFTFPGRAITDTGVGIYMRRSTKNGDIEIQSITIT